MSLNPFTTHWYYNTESGELTNAPNFEGVLESGLAGWHELNIPGSDSEAQAAAAAEKEFPTGTKPTTSLSQGEKNALQQETGISNPLDFLKSIGDFFTKAWSVLTNGNFYIRVAKVVVGGTLVIVGMMHMTGTDKAIKPIVSTAAKAAVL